jgi:tRNA pseudouridine55 synthase
MKEKVKTPPETNAPAGKQATDMPAQLSLASLPVYDRSRLPARGTDLSGGALFLVDKPTGWSSFDVVKFLRARIGVRKTGHAGTLDPLATGLLVICAGRATKSISKIQDLPKRYLAEVCLGASTPSQDIATQPDGHAPCAHVTEDQVRTVLRQQFSGKIRQVPPMYSALWKDGKRLYTYARKGVEVERDPRDVEIHEIRLVSFQGDRLELDVLCSKGTYVRTLAHDLGKALGTLAHLTALRRTAIGPYHAVEAAQIDQIRSYYENKA